MTLSLADLEHPIVQAPMAGGPSTPALAAAVSEAGGLGFLAAGYRPADGVAADIAAVRERTDRPFGLNVFVPSDQIAEDRPAAARFAESLVSEVQRYGVALGDPRHDDGGWEEKLALAEQQRVAVVSFTFGCPAPRVVERVQASRAAVWVTVTTPAEAAQARDAGADALVLQGAEAGGHRGSFDDRAAEEDLGLLALIAFVRAGVDLPLVAGGSVTTGGSVAAVLAAGAAAAQLGTAFMLAPEAATNPAHRRALASGAPTGLTRAFSGRRARGIVNRFMREHGDQAPSAYPAVHHLTAPLRAAARERGDADGFNLWAGQAHALAVEAPAGELVRRLSGEAAEALREAAARFSG